MVFIQTMEHIKTKYMKKSLLTFGLFLLLCSCVQKNEKTDIQEITEKLPHKILTQKRPLTEYKSIKLKTFYKDYGNEITDFTVVNTNGVFSGVIFKSKEKGAYIVELDTTISDHPNPKVNTGQIVNFNEMGIGNCIIKNIRL